MLARIVGGSCALSHMSDRTVEFESALRAQAGLISQPRELLARYLSKEIGRSPALIDYLLELADTPKQREAERLPREALGEREPGNIATTTGNRRRSIPYLWYGHMSPLLGRRLGVREPPRRPWNPEHEAICGSARFHAGERRDKGPVH